MRKALIVMIACLASGFLFAQGGISGTGTAQLTVPPIFLYGMPVTFTVNVNLAGVTTSTPATVGLGGFVVPVGFDKTKFTYLSAAGATPFTGAGGTFASTDKTIANTNGFIAVVGATSTDTNGPTYNPATVTGQVMAFGNLVLDLTSPAGTPAQVALSLSSKWTSANGGPETITSTGTDTTKSVQSRILLAGGYQNNAGFLPGGDYDGDKTTDYAVFRPSTNSWYVRTAGTTLSYILGAAGDFLVPGDYDNDGKCDWAVWTPSTGLWTVKPQAGGTITQTWGSLGDIPVPGDYDGDGQCDWAVFRTSTSTWYIRTRLGASLTRQWGNSGDIPVPGDYDNDGKCDYAIFRPSTSTWYVRTMLGGSLVRQWGAAGDIVVPGDYDGDGTCDWAVFRPSNSGWYIRTQTAAFLTRNYGAGTDLPVSGDYDGDAKMDYAVYRPSNNTFYIRTMAGGQLFRSFGAAGDIVIAR